MNIVLWILQVLFGLYFLAVGVMHFIIPPGLPAQMNWMYDLPAWLHWVSGIAEILGGLGLILPGLFRIQTRLVPLAAIGLALFRNCHNTPQTASNSISPPTGAKDTPSPGSLPSSHRPPRKKPIGMKTIAPSSIHDTKRSPPGRQSDRTVNVTAKTIWMIEKSVPCEWASVHISRRASLRKSR